MKDTLERIVKLAEGQRTLRLGYRRPGEPATAEYVVEPYRLHRTAAGLSLYAWQLSPPPPPGRPAWRDFRVDRIATAEDGGAAFQPRIHATIGQSEATAFDQWGDQPIAPIGPAEQYFQSLETTMLDGQVTPQEMSLAESLGQRIEPQERHGVHARVFANVLHEVLQDGRISHREEIYLRQVREMLERLGWAP